MPATVAEKLITAHILAGRMEPDQDIELRIDQTLTQDATGTLVMLELEAMHLQRVRTEVSVQYVDHNLLQEDFKNPDDHLFLMSACQRFGLWYSPPGNGVSHPIHQERFGIPGKSLLGSDSHTCAAGALGMLAIGAGGLEVALAMAGEPFHVRMPKIWGVRLTGQLPDWVSAKDVILEMLRRHGVDGGLGKIIEYHGPGLSQLSAMDRHVIANMGAELGATASIFPSDAQTRRFLQQQGREHDWVEIVADENCCYDIDEEIDLSTLEPLIAMPSSPANVVPVREVAGQEIYQAYVGSSANPGYRDFAMAAEIVKGKRVAPGISFDINPTSRQILENLVHDGHLLALIHAGGRVHQAGCNGCIGMGQAPVADKLSLRTVPRNFPGRSGTLDDKVCLVSPETAAASALTGVVTDPRTLKMPYPRVSEPERPLISSLLQRPLSAEAAEHVQIRKGSNIESLPELDPLPRELDLPVLLKAGDNVSTDEIMPAGARVLPYRSNIRKISEFVFERIDPTYAARTQTTPELRHAVLAGENYGQGSSREHAALAPRYLGLRAVLAKSFARIHRQNLINFGVLPLILSDWADYNFIQPGDVLRFNDLHSALRAMVLFAVENVTQRRQILVRHDMSARDVENVIAGGLTVWMRDRAGVLAH